jgi:Ca2+-binding EF-hand superfamily protein
VLRALGFDPTSEEIVKLIRDLGKGDQKFDSTRIDFQEFLEIMIVKMSQKDSLDDIKKAFNLFKDP